MHYVKQTLENTIYSTGFAVIESKNTNLLNTLYLYYLFMFSSNLMQQIEIAMPKGQYPSINDKDIKNFEISLPSISEQEKIVTEIEKLELQIAENQKIIDESKAKKNEVLRRYL